MVLTKEDLPATYNTLTRRVVPVNQEFANAGMYMSYLDWYRHFRLLTSHPEWFAKDFDLTIQTLENDPVIGNSPSIEVFRTINRNSTKERDQDFKTQINFFRGNFYTKLLLAFSLAMIDDSPGVGFNGSLKQWLGSDYDQVNASLTDFLKRITVRKNNSHTAEELENSLLDDSILARQRQVLEDMLQLNLEEEEQLKQALSTNTKGKPRNKLSIERIKNYRLRIEETKETQLVGMEEVEKSFDLAELCWSFLKMKTGRMKIDSRKRKSLIEKATSKIEIPMPIRVPGLDDEKYAPKPIE